MTIGGAVGKSTDLVAAEASCRIPDYATAADAYFSPNSEASRAFYLH